MQIVIDISTYDAEWICNAHCIPDEISSKIADAIITGTPLPEGHGRLKDVDWIDDNCPYYYSDEDARLCYAVNDVNEAPTIIKPDKEEKE